MPGEFTADETQQLNALLLHAHEVGDAEGFAALEELAHDPAAFRKAVAGFKAAQSGDEDAPRPKNPAGKGSLPPRVGKSFLSDWASRRGFVNRG